MIAALGQRGGGHVVHLLDRTVEAVVHHHQRPAPAAPRRRARGPVEVARQVRALVADAHRLDRAAREAAGRAEALDALAVGRVDARIGRVAVQEELGAAVVVGSAQEGIARARGMAAAEAAPRLGLDAFGSEPPFVVPAVVVAGADALRGDSNLAEVGAA
ncbi:hypothetical protein [Variovorax sp. UC122_21]|uniref:hypothetical protein n=1 Tax=Variovorax sp. UC122_21 TaxID=3374554 RepID=UPI0037582713